MTYTAHTNAGGRISFIASYLHRICAVHVPGSYHCAFAFPRHFPSAPSYGYFTVWEEVCTPTAPGASVSLVASVREAPGHTQTLELRF